MEIKREEGFFEKIFYFFSKDGGKSNKETQNYKRATKEKESKVGLLFSFFVF